MIKELRSSAERPKEIIKEIIKGALCFNKFFFNILYK